MYVQTIRNTVYGPKGETFGVVYDTITEPYTEWYWTEQEAWDRRDELLDMHIRGVRVIGSATVVAVAGLGSEEDDAPTWM